MDSKDDDASAVKALKGMLRKPAKPVSIEQMNDAIRKHGGTAAAALPPAPDQQAEKGAGLSVGGAFLAGVAVGLAVSDQAPHGEPAHVHLSLGDDDNSDKDGKECDHDQGRDFDR